MPERAPVPPVAAGPLGEGPLVSAAPGAGRPLEASWLGRIPYDEALALQQALVERRRHGEIEDRLVLLEHPHVITLGSASGGENVLLGRREMELLGIRVFETGRGGDVTYHGPGQLVGYPILDLKPDRRDLHAYIRDLEEVLIRTVAEHGIAGGRRPGLSGVWVGRDKVAAIGVRVSSGWITSHGFALNVSTDLRYFESIVPCGIRDGGVTSIERLTGRTVPLEDVAESTARHFRAVFGRVAPS
jgi:lipoyl(octanoyl) transferase